MRQKGSTYMTEITTTDLAKFGYHERVIMEELLKAWRTQGLPEDFNEDEVVVMCNLSSGNVFLTNSDYAVAMLNDDKLESFYSCPVCGHEGFLEDMQHNTNSAECVEYVNDITGVK